MATIWQLAKPYLLAKSEHMPLFDGGSALKPMLMQRALVNLGY